LKEDEFMAAPRAYLDHNATTPLRPAARAEVIRVLTDVFGNPSSVHGEGRAARKAIETARQQVASAVGGAAPLPRRDFTFWRKKHQLFAGVGD
jgi:cysteine sulfinate desulfinase/cysteine desulfurase-like protein